MEPNKVVSEVKPISQLTQEELNLLPSIEVRFSKRLIKDRVTQKVTSATYLAEPLIHQLITPKISISQAQFGLAVLASGKDSAMTFSLPARVQYSKGVRKNGEKFYFAEYFTSGGISFTGFFSLDEVKLLNGLAVKKAITISFKQRPDTQEEPKVESETGDDITI